MWTPHRLLAREVGAVLLGVVLLLVYIFVSSRSGDVRYPSSNPTEEA